LVDWSAPVIALNASQPAVMSDVSKKESAGAFELVRGILTRARVLGAAAITYHVSPSLDQFQQSKPHIFFINGSKFSRHMLPDEHAEVLGRCHEFISKLGRPIILSNFIVAFESVEPELTKQILAEAKTRGVEDQIMIPVYGPFGMKGLCTFAFKQRLNWRTDLFLKDLEQISAAFHNSIIRYFSSAEQRVALSKRESEVLHWVAHGKSNYEIAQILDLSESSVDTYLRRIFDKMNVNDRVSAAVQGVTSGVV